MPWWVTMDAIFSARIIHVPPLNLPDWAENDPSFHKLDPPLNSAKRAYLRHATSGNLVSWSKRTYVLVVVFRKIDLISRLSVFVCQRILVPDCVRYGWLWWWFLLSCLGAGFLLFAERSEAIFDGGCWGPRAGARADRKGVSHLLPSGSVFSAVCDEVGGVCG